MSESLASLALGFAVRTDGALDPPTLARFRHFAQARCGAQEPDATDRALATAVALYRGGDGLFLCGSKPCAGAFGFDVSAATVERVERRTELATFVTGCQGHCKHKPVVSLRIEERREIFGALSTNEERELLFEHARAAHTLGSTLVPGSRVEPFRFDLEHGAGPANHLPATRFLAGRFRGEGSYVAAPYTFFKEVVGAYEPGGRFMTLHMEARYPSENGGKDLHRALVVVGAAAGGARLVGKAFTDGGDVLEYDVDCADGRLAFDDRSPDHAVSCRRARKVLIPTGDGYEEHLLVDRGSGLEPYYSVVMRRAALECDASVLATGRHGCSPAAGAGGENG